MQHRIHNAAVNRRGGGVIKVNHAADYTCIIRLIMRLHGLSSKYGMPNPWKFPAAESRVILNLTVASVSPADSQPKHFVVK
jgi:hypothetical protein